MTSEFASTTPIEHKDRWQTPVEVFTALDLEFGFYLDAAADHQNALCARQLCSSQTNSKVTCSARPNGRRVAARSV